MYDIRLNKKFTYQKGMMRSIKIQAGSFLIIDIVAEPIVMRPINPIKRLHHPKLTIFVTASTTKVSPKTIIIEDINTNPHLLSLATT
jgi:hypothetical protein